MASILPTSHHAVKAPLNGNHAATQSNLTAPLNGNSLAAEIRPTSQPQDTSEIAAQPPTAAQALLDELSGQNVKVGKEIHAIPGGGYQATEIAEGPDYKGSYQSLLDSNGQVVDRDYSSQVTERTPTVTTDPNTYQWVDSFIVSEEKLHIREQTSPEGATESNYQKQELLYYANDPHHSSTTTQSSESDTVDTVLTRPDGGERLYSETLPEGSERPKLGEGKPITAEVTNSTLPDGSLQRTHLLADDLTGYVATETVTVAPDGQSATRTTDKVTPSKEVTDNLEGLGILSAYGHDSAQTLYDQHLGDGPITQRSGTSVTEQLDAEGKVISSSSLETTQWSNEDGSRSLTMIERGENLPPEYLLTIKEGDKVSTQRFIAGTEDTEITKQFTDAEGFRTVSVETQSSESADRALEDGQSSAVDGSLHTSRHKAEAGLEDLKGLLGQDFDSLTAGNPEFATLAKGLKGAPFGLLEIESKTTLIGHESTRQESHRAIGISTAEGVRTLTFDQESGGWTLSKASPATQSQDPSGQLDLVQNTGEAVQASVNKSPGMAASDLVSQLGWAGSAADRLKALNLTTLSSVARGLGLVGTLYQAGNGAYDLLANGNPRGVFDILSGGGGALGLLGVVSAPVATGAAVVGFAGKFAYDYIDETDMAEVQI